MQQDTVTNDSPVAYPKDYNPSLNGIDGWLIIFVIVQFVKCIIGFLVIINTAPYIGVSGELNAYYFILFIVATYVMFFGSIAILFFTFSHNILFRKTFVIQNIVMIAFVLFAYIFVTNLDSTHTISNSGSSFISELIWGVYLYQSIRVRNTFIYAKKYHVRFGQKMLNLK